MKLAILLVISLVFISCGRKTGPNSKPKNNNSASNTSSVEPNNSLKCNEFSKDTNAMAKKIVDIESNGISYKLNTTAVIYNSKNTKWSRICVAKTLNDWNEIKSSDAAITADNDEELNKVCGELLKNKELSQANKSLKDIIKEVPEASNFETGFIIEVVNSDNTQKVKKTYLCNHTLLNIKK